MARTGRPEKLNHKQIGEQLEAMAMLGIRDVTKVSFILGVSRQAMGRYMKKYPELIVAFDRGKERGALKLKNRAWKMAMAGEWPALKYCLENLTEWRDKAQAATLERTQVIVYLPAVESDTNGKHIIEVASLPAPGGNGHGNGHANGKDPGLEAPQRPTD